MKYRLWLRHFLRECDGSIRATQWEATEPDSYECLLRMAMKLDLAYCSLVILPVELEPYSRVEGRR